MNILMLSSLCFPRTIGGVENHILYLSKFLMKAGHNVEVVVPVIGEQGKKGPYTSEYQGIKITEIHIHGLPALLKMIREKYSGRSMAGMFLAFVQKASFLLAAFQIASITHRLMKEKQMNILHQHDLSANIITTKLLARHYPVVLTNHTGEFLVLNRNRVTRLLIRFMLNHYKKIIGPSLELSDVPYFTNKVVYIPNGVDTAFFSAVDKVKRKEIRESMGFNDDSFVVFCPRRWAPTKGIIYLAKAMPDVLKHVPTAVFLFAGSDYEGYPLYKNEILNVLRELDKRGFKNNYRLLGNLDADQMLLYYRISDLVVIPSLMEATSLAALV